MRLEPIRAELERHGRGTPTGLLRLGDTPSMMPELLQRYAGTVKLIYLDPPYLTGQRFFMRVRAGEEDWKRGYGSLKLETFRDPRDRGQYLAMLRTVLTGCRDLLRGDGMLFLHVDYRLHPYLRLMLDELFGEDNFLNEIIWAYNTGGRALNHFSRKHDVILFYRKSEDYDFDMKSVMVRPSVPRSNHMKRHVDPDGRVYRSIRSGGRVYTYYDDDPVAPGDVWTDLNHLQQRDPERTGYDTQKPLALLERIVRCASREGELVADLFAGSCTTLEAAARLGRRFLGVDRCPLSLNIARRRLSGRAYELQIPADADTEAPECRAQMDPGIGFWRVTLRAFGPSPDSRLAGLQGMDAVDGWSVGYLRPDGSFECMAESLRSRRTPAPAPYLELPMYEGTAVLSVNDAAGHSYYYRISPSTSI